MPYVIRKTKNADGSVEIEKYYTARRTQREKPVKKTGKIIDRLRQLVSGDFANESEKIVKDEEGSTDELIEKYGKRYACEWFVRAQDEKYLRSSKKYTDKKSKQITVLAVTNTVITAILLALTIRTSKQHQRKR